MRAVDIIIRKRDRQELSQAEIDFFIEGFTRGEIPDYQAAAFAMAVLLNGMSPRETTDLTLAMAHSGETLDLTGVVAFVVDKHSTGGVGDKTSLVAGPVVAASGLPVGKVSGRGLGFSGGTLDKLESISGFRCDLTSEAFLHQLRTVGLVITGQSADLAPADGKLYSLRDVTGTVPSIPLVASSVMSKKIAAGAQAIVLDVKAGVGAFMVTVEAARELAHLMVQIGHLAGRQTVALISDMNQPLGRTVGNALEVREAIETLRGGGPEDFRAPDFRAPDFRAHCLEVAAHMLLLGQRAPSLDEARALAAATLNSGKAWEAFRQMVAAQHGDVSQIDHPERLPQARYVETVPAPREGYLSSVHARLIGETAVQIGAGRAKKGDPVDHAVGFVIHHKVGDFLHRGEPLFTIHANHPSHVEEARAALLRAHEWSAAPVEPLPLFYGVVTA